MKLDLQCPHCDCRFDGQASGVRLEQMAEEGPWLALGDGETFEDRLHASITAEGAICCPQCASPVSVTEACLGKLALELLGQW